MKLDLAAGVNVEITGLISPCDPAGQGYQASGHASSKDRTRRQSSGRLRRGPGPRSPFPSRIGIQPDGVIYTLGPRPCGRSPLRGFFIGKPPILDLPAPIGRLAWWWVAKPDDPRLFQEDGAKPLPSWRWKAIRLSQTNWIVTAKRGAAKRRGCCQGQECFEGCSWPFRQGRGAEDEGRGIPASPRGRASTSAPKSRPTTSSPASWSTQGHTQGKGFAGAMKRWGFGGTRHPRRVDQPPCAPVRR